MPSLDIFPERLNTPPAVLLELPTARAFLAQLPPAQVQPGLRQAAAAACRASVSQVAVFVQGANASSGRRLAEDFGNLTILGLFRGEGNASEAVLQIEELTAGGSAALLFEAELRASWAPLLVDFPALQSAARQADEGGWFSAVHPGPPIRMELVSAADAGRLPEELRGFFEARAWEEGCPQIGHGAGSSCYLALWP
ncbi:unnamed protein product [Effrenium voratum]|nr:unnamed protein product [Effrenium voratum]